jgi:hypothetical protein
MKALLPLIVLVVMAFVVLAVLKRTAGKGTGGETGPWPLFVKKPLSAPEQVLYHRLVKALPEHIVLAQVQVSRVLGVYVGCISGSAPEI